MSRNLRVDVLRDLIELRLPLGEATAALARFPWDSDAELVALTRADALRLLRRYLDGDVTAVDCQRWAEALERRDDVGLEPGFEDLLKELLFETATPALFGDLTPALAATWETTLRTAEGGRTTHAGPGKPERPLARIQHPLNLFTVRARHADQSARPLMPVHLAAQAGIDRRWRPIVTCVLVLIWAGPLAWLAGYWGAAAAPEGGVPLLGAQTALAVKWAVAAAVLPVAMATVWLVEHRPASTVWSVRRRLRWPLLVVFAAVAVPAAMHAAAVTSAFVATPLGVASSGPSQAGGVLPRLATLTVLLILAAGQAAALVYLSGIWLQACGAVYGSSWSVIVGAASMSLLAQQPSGYWHALDVVITAVILGWITLRTGGLEAALALVFAHAAVYAGQAVAGSAVQPSATGEVSWAVPLIHAYLLIGYAAIVSWIAPHRRTGHLYHAGAAPPGDLSDARQGRG
ncbi:hypothetical protein [Plantactinospora sp. CA-290183]|uniref:hypothetical protein n=1 Tax=Plantactinospora sp. CA-290183 TaxID=3240006 RepID=UPI003D8A31CF